jgi:uncharacterized membrane protein HdeD (DUF308 family)
VSHASPQAPENRIPNESDAIPWAARLRFGTRTLLLGLTGIAAAAPLTTKGLVFNAIALVLTALALMLQLMRKPLGHSVAAQLVIAVAYAIAGATILLAPHHRALCAYALGAALLTAGAARFHAAHRALDGARSAAIAPAVISGLLGLMAIAGWPTNAPWQLGFLIAAELVVGGVSSLQRGFAQWSAQRAAKPSG